MSDVTWQAIIGGIVTIVLTWMQYRTRMAVAAAARDAQVDRETVKTALEEATYETDSKLNVIHDLVNKAHGEALRLAACSSERLARLTKEPADIEAAQEARQLYDDYVAKQSLADIRQQTREGEARR